MASTANEIAISFEVGNIASAVNGIDSLASSMARLGQASGAALMPVQNPFEGLLTGLTALPGAAGKAALGLKTFMQGLDALNTFLNTQAQAQLSFGQSQRFLGTDPKTTAILQTLGAGTGVDMDALAHSIRTQAFSSPGHAEAISKLGYPYVPEPGAMDEGKALLDHIEKLRELGKTNAAEAQRLAKNEEPALLKFLAISDDAWAQVKDFAEARMTRFGPQGEQHAMERAMQNAMRDQAAKEGWVPNSFSGPNGIPHPNRDRLDRQQEHLKQNTQAVQENTEQLSKMNGIFGGGARMRGAIPKSFQGRGDQLEDYFKSQKVNFGAYAVGQ